MNVRALLVSLASLSAMMTPMAVSNIYAPVFPKDDKKLHLCTSDETVIFACTSPAAMLYPITDGAGADNKGVDDQHASAAKGDMPKISICLGDNKLTYRSGISDTALYSLASDENWSNIHLGSVIGGSGGHQTHIRFTAPDTSDIIVFEGAPGQYHDANDGKPWAGEFVMHATGNDDDARRNRRTCHMPYSGLMGSITGNQKILEQAPKQAVRDRLIYETEGGPFDGWF